jgi:4-hydroxybenzoate polyprenyltransferase
MIPIMPPLIRALRPLHVLKNALLFMPLLLAHRAGDRDALLAVTLAFFAFCLVASGTYLVNDVCDLRFDRLHPNKRHRMIASGAVPARLAAIVGASLMIGGVLIASQVSLQVIGYLAAYSTLSLAYSLFLKRRVFVDVLTLSALWTIRVLAGGAAARVDVSDWLLAYSVFLFVGLALLKRYADLGLLASQEEVTVQGNGYVAGDRDLLRSMGVASGYLSVLVLALYVASSQVTHLYRSPRLLWLVCPLMLYWIAHMWFLAHRGAISDDPIIVATRDPVSYAVGAMIALAVFAAI